MNTHAAIHAGLRQLGIEEDDARDLYARVTGKRSLREMSDIERQAVVSALRGKGFKPAAKGLEGPFAAKLQALWIAAWNLGLVRDRRDPAMLAFVKRQTGIEHTRFLRDPADAAKAIEALKGWMAREAKVDWRETEHMPAWEKMPGAKIALAQWRILRGQPHDAAEDFLSFKEFAEQRAFNPLVRMTAREWAGVMNALGERIRAARR